MTTTSARYAETMVVLAFGYWLQRVAVVGVFLLSFAYFGMLATPDLTWVSVDHDLGDTLWSTRVFGLQHPTGAPLYTALGWLVSRGVDDWGDQAHRLALVLSALPAAITATILYAKTRTLLAPLLFCAAGLIVSQASVPKYYPLVGLAVLGQWLLRDKPWFWVVSLLGIALHHVPGMVFLFVCLYRIRHVRPNHFVDARKMVVPATSVLVASFFVYLCYWAFAAQPPSDVGWKGADFMRYMGGQGFLLMGLSPYPVAGILGRLRDAALIIPASLGLGLLGLLWAKDRWLLVLSGLVALHYLTELDPHVYTYLYPAITLAILAVCEGDSPPRFQWAAAGIAALMIAWNVQHYDIGRNLDPTPTAARDAYEQFAALPAGSVVAVGELGAWDFMPFLFEGRFETILDKDRHKYIVTHCVADVDLSTLRGRIVPLGQGCE